MSDDLVHIGSLWENESKNGHAYFAGYLGQAKLLVFRNREKDGDEKTPDWHVFVSPGRAQREAQGDRKGQQGGAPASAQATPPGETRHRKIREAELPKGAPW